MNKVEDLCLASCAEEDWSIDRTAENLELPQLVARDLLVFSVGVEPTEATEYVRKIGVTVSIALKFLLQNSSTPVRHFEDFKNSFAAARADC